MVVKSQRRTTFPALRCQMGDWIYYVTYLRFADVSEWIKKTDEIHKSEKLQELIQREIGDRVNPIVEYLNEQKERFFNGIVVGVYQGSPQWLPIELKDSPVLGAPDLDVESRQSIGLLKLEGQEKLFAIDGQHRVVAIKRALKKRRSLGTEEICAIFVAHGENEQGRMRTRRLFSTLNRYAVPVSKGEIVALSEDDAFAITTRSLVEESPLLKSGMNNETGFVRFQKGTAIPASDWKSLTTVLSLYDITANTHVPILDKVQRRKMARLKHRRPPDTTLAAIYKQQTRYWRLLEEQFPEYRELFKSQPEEKIAGKYRTSDGGHLMFRPIGQQAFARATRTMMDRGVTMSQAIKQLSRAPMNLNSRPWAGVVWNNSTKRINSKLSPFMVDGLLLYYAGQKPRKDTYDLLTEYRKALGDPSAKLRRSKPKSKGEKRPA